MIVFRDVAPVQPNFGHDSEEGLHARQNAEGNELSNVSRQDSDGSIETAKTELRTTTGCSSPNPAEVRLTPPSRPTPQRLPTPDLPKFEESDFWSCCEPSDSNWKETYGSFHNFQGL